MAMKQVIEMYELLDSAKINGRTVAEFLRNRGTEQVDVTPIKGEKGSTDFIKATIPGLREKPQEENPPLSGSWADLAESAPGLSA